MRAYFSVVSAASLLLGLGACTVYNLAGPENFKSADRGGMRRASFELQCPEKDLAVSDLGGAVGVTGCGRRAIYKWVQGVGWVNDTGVQNAPPPQK